MTEKRPKYSTIDEYISDYPKEVQVKLQALRKLINTTAPKATEAISYGIPAFRLGEGRAFIFFAAFAKHISVYPFPSGVKEFQELAKGYETAKGTIKFPLDKELPMDLVKKIVEYRMKEKLESEKNKKSSY